MSDDRDWYRPFDVKDPAAAAKETAARFEEDVEAQRLSMEPTPARHPRRVLHLTVLGNHLDPDLGRWYVAAKPKLNRRERSLRHHREAEHAETPR